MQGNIILFSLLVSLTFSASSSRFTREPDWSLEGTPCGRELRLGRYQREIAKEFPLLQDGTPTFIHAGRGQNLFCRCDSRSWMTCMLVALTPVQENIAEERLNPEIRERLLPFWFLEVPGYNPQITPLVYTHPLCKQEIVFAEIMVLYRSWAPSPNRREPVIAPWPVLERERLPLHPPAITRTNSAPSALNHPEHFMDIKLCHDDVGGGECPIKQEGFRPKQIVYILKQDESKVAQGKPVACISAIGLTQLSRTAASRANGGFLDPLNRISGFLTINDHFTPYLLLSDVGSIEDCAPENMIGLSQGRMIARGNIFTLFLFISIVIFTFLHSNLHKKRSYS